MNVSDFKTLVFDCDGVVLNSNKVKTDAFFKVGLVYGEAAANCLVDYHTLNGGISRYKKFDWFLQNIVAGQKGPNLEQMLAAYAIEVKSGLYTCDITDALADLREHTRQAKWLIVSGGDQDELREVFSARGLSQLFDGGIFGSPDSKDIILARELSKKNITLPALYLGDSRYDHIVAKTVNIDFLFLSMWTEFDNWLEYCLVNNIKVRSCVSELM